MIVGGGGGREGGFGRLHLHFTNKYKVLPRSDGVRGQHLQSVSWTVQIHHQEADGWNA